MSKVYKFEVRKIVSTFVEIEAGSKSEAFDKLDEQLMNEREIVCIDDEDDVLIAADARLVNNGKWVPMIHSGTWEITTKDNQQ